MSSILPFSEILQNLRSQGYTVSFSFGDNGLLHSAGTSIITPDEFTIDAQFNASSLFEPLEEITIYAISSDQNHIKGILISSDHTINSRFSQEMMAIFNLDSLSKTSEKNLTSTTQSTVKATRQRPEGERVLNQEILTFDIDALIGQIKSEEAWTKSDRNSLTIFKNGFLCMVIIGLQPDAAMKKHSATAALTVQVLQGSLVFETENQKSELTVGNIIVLPAGIPHQVYALKESFFLLTLALQK